MAPNRARRPTRWRGQSFLAKALSATAVATAIMRGAGRRQRRRRCRRGRQAGAEGGCGDHGRLQGRWAGGGGSVGQLGGGMPRCICEGGEADTPQLMTLKPGRSWSRRRRAASPPRTNWQAKSGQPRPYRVFCSCAGSLCGEVSNGCDVPPRIPGSSPACRFC
jgi:hypothetical protein